MIVELFNIVAPVMFCAAIGYGWIRLGHDFDTAVVTRLVTNIGAPCLIIATLGALKVSPAAFGQMAGAAALALASFMVISAIILRIAGLPYNSFLAPLVFPNAGNMGLPICLFAFGEQGLALAIAFFAITSTGQFTVGQLIWSGEVKLMRIVRTPVIWAVLIAVALMVTEAKPPLVVTKTLELLAGFTIPLMLIALGVSLGRLRIASLKRSIALSVLRLAMGFAVGLTLAWALGFEGTARGVLIVLCAMPTAVFNYLFAQQHGRLADEVAGMVVLSSLISFATLPLLLLVVL